MSEQDPEPLSPQMREMVDRSLGRPSDSSHGNTPRQASADDPSGWFPRSPDLPPDTDRADVLREWRRARPQWEQDLVRIRLWVTVIGWCVLLSTAAGLFAAFSVLSATD